MRAPLKAPFPYFGGKSAIAEKSVLAMHSPKFMQNQNHNRGLTMKTENELTNNRDPHLTIFGWHHGFIGLVLALAGLAIILSAPTASAFVIVLGALLAAVGLWLFVDDLYQHIVQHWRPGYRSPVNRLWAWFLRGFCD